MLNKLSEWRVRRKKTSIGAASEQGCYGATVTPGQMVHSEATDENGDTGGREGCCFIGVTSGPASRVFFIWRQRYHERCRF